MFCDLLRKMENLTAVNNLKEKSENLNTQKYCDN
jgi:hypothetical protein